MLKNKRLRTRKGRLAAVLREPALAVILWQCGRDGVVELTASEELTFTEKWKEKKHDWLFCFVLNFSAGKAANVQK